MFGRWSNSRYDEERSPEQTTLKVNELRTKLGSLVGHDLIYCDDSCLRRYLAARNWNVDKSKKMLEETLKWRSTYKPEKIRWPEIAFESETGKLYRASFHDREGRTVLIMKPGKQNTASIENQIRHLVYLMENALLNLPEGQEQMSWLIDFNGWSRSTSVPIKSARETATILQNHYPERLAVAFLYNPPRIFETFWRVVKYFLDPKTFQKVRFVYPKKQESVELMKTYFDEENLPSEFGGKALMEYDHDEYSRLMIQYDIKCAAFWESSEKYNHICSGNSSAAVAPE